VDLRLALTPSNFEGAPFLSEYDIVEYVENRDVV